MVKIAGSHLIGRALRGGDTRRRTVALGVGTGRKVTVFTHPPAREALPDTTRVKKPVTRPSLSVRSLVGCRYSFYHVQGISILYGGGLIPVKKW